MKCGCAATRFPGSLASALASLRDGGTIVEVGAVVAMGDERLDPAELCGRSLALLGVGGEDLLCYEGTLARHAAPLRLGEIVSHRFGIGDVAEAMELALALDPARSVKVVVVPERSPADGIPVSGH